MTTQISFPSEFDNLSDDDQKLVKDLMKSIVQAEEATKILLDLLGSKELHSDLPEFRENCKKHFNKKLNLEIVNSSINSDSVTVLPMNTTANDNVPPPPPPAPIAPNSTRSLSLQEIMRRMADTLIQSADIIRCRQICEQAPLSQECRNCQPILNRN